jgi:hypothetical protein
MLTAPFLVPAIMKPKFGRFRKFFLKKAVIGFSEITRRAKEKAELSPRLNIFS